MHKVQFFKMHGCGNDFVIIYANQINKNDDIAEFIKKINNRKTGVGFDQLIFLSKSEKSDIKMDIYNHDATVAEACGNATRCVAWLVKQDLDKKIISIEVNKKILTCDVDGMNVSVNMGKAKFSAKDIPVSDGYSNGIIDFGDELLGKGYVVNVGNPHLVFINNDITIINPENDLAKYESHNYFPEKINVSVISVNKQSVEQIIYERGAGKTLSCGTAACAAFAILVKYFSMNDPVTISQPGGEIKLDKNEENEIIMPGIVTFVFKGEIDTKNL